MRRLSLPPDLPRLRTRFWNLFLSSPHPLAHLILNTIAYILTTTITTIYYLSLSFSS